MYEGRKKEEEINKMMKTPHLNDLKRSASAAKRSRMLMSLPTVS